MGPYHNSSPQEIKMTTFAYAIIFMAGGLSLVSAGILACG
jgi:hypothetical protein